MVLRDLGGKRQDGLGPQVADNFRDYTVIIMIVLLVCVASTGWLLHSGEVSLPGDWASGQRPPV